MRRIRQTRVISWRASVGAFAVATLAGTVVATGPAANAAPVAPATTRAVSAVTVTSVVTFPVVPKGYPARVRGSVTRDAGSTVTVQLQRKSGTTWTSVSEQVLAPDSPNKYAFELPTATTSRHTYRVAASSSPDSSTAATPGFSVRVVAAKIRRVQPDGDEFVVLRNTGTTTIGLKRWHLGTPKGVLLLPARSIHAGDTLRIYTGTGTNSPSRLYLGLTNNLWHQHGTALLTTTDELVVARRTF